MNESSQASLGINEKAKRSLMPQVRLEPTCGITFQQFGRAQNFGVHFISIPIHASLPRLEKKVSTGSGAGLPATESLPALD